MSTSKVKSKMGLTNEKSEKINQSLDKAGKITEAFTLAVLEQIDDSLELTHTPSQFHHPKDADIRGDHVYFIHKKMEKDFDLNNDPNVAFIFSREEDKNFTLVASFNQAVNKISNVPSQDVETKSTRKETLQLIEDINSALEENDKKGYEGGISLSSSQISITHQKAEIMAQALNQVLDRKNSSVPRVEL